MRVRKEKDRRERQEEGERRGKWGEEKCIRRRKTGNGRRGWKRGDERTKVER